MSETKTLGSRRISLLVISFLFIFILVFSATSSEAADDGTRYLPITYEHVRYDQEGGGSDIWYTIIPAKYKMHYSYAEDKLFGREIHSASCKRHGATLAVNTQFLGYPIINGVRPVPDQNMNLSMYDFYITQNSNPATAYDVFDVHVTTDPTDEKAGISFQDINLGFEYDGDHVPHENCFGVYNGEIYMALFAQIIKDGEVRTSGTPYLQARHPRTWIAYDYDGNQFVATAAGRNAPLLDGTQLSQYGLRYDEMVDFTKRYMPEIKTMYNLDGGGSCSFVYKGEKLSPHYDTNAQGVRYERKNYGTYYWKVEKRKVTTHHFVKGSDTKLSDDVVEIMYEGDEYSTQPITKEHYKLTETPLNATGVLEGNIEVNYYYELDHDLIKTGEVPATCTDDGNIEYWTCQICDKHFKDKKAVYEIKEADTVINKIGHSVFKVAAKHATCFEEGISEHWECGRCGSIFSDKDAIDGIQIDDTISAKKAHIWSVAMYSWSGDNAAVTAYRICTASNSPHMEKETVMTSSSVIRGPNCTEPGQTEYTAVFTNPDFDVQTRRVDDIPVDSNAHDEDRPEFVWSGDNSMVRGTIVCRKNGEHRFSETVNTMSDLTSVPTCTSEGIMTHTAAFSDSHFGTITATSIIPAKGHTWNDGVITTSPTDKNEGEKLYTCDECGETRKEIIPAVPARKISGIVIPRVTAKGKRTLEISWNEASGVDGYDIYLAEIGKEYRVKKTIGAGNTASTKWKIKNLKSNTGYKICVRAYVMQAERKEYVIASPEVMAYTSGGTAKYTNPKKLVVKNKNRTLEEGETFTIKATVKKSKKDTKKKLPAKIARKRYISDDPNVATVSKTGNVRGISKGTCRVYVYAANGINEAVIVTVR